MNKAVTHKVYLGLGTNLGDKLMNLENACSRINDSLASVLRTSSVYSSEAWGYESENVFFNLCLELESSLQPEELLVALKAIEKEQGRVKLGTEYEDRIIDIDILLFDDLILDSPGLKIPHQSMEKRNFVLFPLEELIPDYVHPVLGLPLSVLRKKCTDSGSVHRINKSSFQNM